MATAENDELNSPDDFVRLWSAHRAQLFNFIFSLLPSAAEAEEVFQRVSIVLWKKFDELQNSVDFWRWASRVAQLEVLSYRRRMRSERLQFWTAEAIDLISAAHYRQTDFLNVQQTALRDCLAKLRDGDRQLVDLRYGADRLSTKAIASRLERPLVTLYKTLGRIRRTLYECIQRKLSSEQGS